MVAVAYEFDITSGADLLGELAPVLDDVDLTPDVGGCGRALPLAAAMLVRGTEAAVPHLEACRDCREAIIGIGRVASGVDALLFFEQVADTETPQAADFLRATA